MKVAIQGQKGSYHYLAATQFFGDGIEIIPCKTFREVFEILASGHADNAVAALENSLYGSLNETYDDLLDFKPYIIGEVYLHISFDLFSTPQASKETITDIYSQAPALSECQEYLRADFPWVRQHEFHDTAAAAAYIAKEKDKTKAAIANSVSGELHNLTAIDENIDDNQHNYTRFAILSMNQQTTTDLDKTSIVLHTANKPGSLYNVLGVFNTLKINLTKIESRPVAGREWHYVFYLDFECRDADKRIEVLSELKKLDHDYTVLGHYKSGSMPNLSQA